MAEPITAKDLIDAGLSRSFAHFVVKGERNLSVPTALWLLDERGLVAGPLVGKSRSQIAALRTVYPAAAPTGVRNRSEARAA